ncbi:SDR family oxidoreductase OS=Streptomyces tendae OX=1932 GN=GUR47_30000 PE=4 SV=1 [Streptomyces tendae]
MLEGTSLPASVRQQFRHYAELLLVFQRELPFDSLPRHAPLRHPRHPARTSARRSVRNLESCGGRGPVRPARPAP